MSDDKIVSLNKYKLQQELKVARSVVSQLELEVSELRNRLKNEPKDQTNE